MIRKASILRSRRTPSDCNDDCRQDLLRLAYDLSNRGSDMLIGVLRLRTASRSEAVAPLRMTLKVYRRHD
jgi:hypothetical protein